MTRMTMTQNRNGIGTMGWKRPVCHLCIAALLLLGVAACLVQNASAVEVQQPGSIQVWTSPGSSWVCVDGTTCRGTPNNGAALFSGLTPNTYHTVTVTVYGYEPFSQTVLVTPQENTVVNANLTPVHR